ncbi:L-lactate dehydrogenase complex protein LldG [Halogranum gelatinilyticum]|uniref:L-lactate dehydrogenase complex protein LldG n=1 Tax=Halogranum gelatinilyticum TaxID=660521 RepID=A0A1G9YYG1_9EURY|nr:LUD domain-containing protein [Halogranum gelatinilyticum]SDN14094.1 L-lactate dehydrogenase complex protein LldG [Halogranum gelatinilyticum]
MHTEVGNTFRTSLDELGVEWTRTTADDASAVLANLVRPPAVGVAGPIEDVALPDAVATDPTPRELRAATTGVTSASLAIADYGSLVLEADSLGSEQTSLFPDRHVAVLRADDIVANMAAAFEQLGPRLRETGGSAVLATGPSATADMGELVRGAHGPKEVHVVIVDDAADEPGGAETGGDDE